jgi:hypothetical protein
MATAYQRLMMMDFLNKYIKNDNDVRDARLALERIVDKKYEGPLSQYNTAYKLMWVFIILFNLFVWVIYPRL